MAGAALNRSRSKHVTFCRGEVNTGHSQTHTESHYQGSNSGTAASTSECQWQFLHLAFQAAYFPLFVGFYLNKYRKKSVPTVLLDPNQVAILLTGFLNGMAQKEAKARIKINNLLEEAGWRFFDTDKRPANITLEHHTKISTTHLNELGENFEQTKNGFLDFLLLDERGFPLVVLEAKAEHIHPLTAKEQARKYAVSQNCRYVILSNGNLHFLWDLERGNPQPIQRFPTPESFQHLNAFHADSQRLANEPVSNDYIALTQKPDYQSDPRWIYESQRERFKRESGLRFLREYQLRAVQELQKAVANGKDRFLFEMATGTGKTLTSAAVVKLFIRTGNARRVLFLVDRLELESQAKKDFDKYLKPDVTTVIYKEKRDDWRNAEVVISTIQSFSHHNKYKRLFRTDDFDLVISDEAHRSIGGNGRAVFDYFIGYKLGLTATPKDYLKKVNTAKLQQRDPRELERRMLLDTYTTFGCENGVPTFRFALLDGVKGGYLVNPTVIDARTSITTQLLSDEGYTVLVEDENGNETEESFGQRNFEKTFFSETTNYIFCETFLKNALRDPVSGEVGKTIIFCVSQNHAAKVTQLLNEQANRLFPGRYQSDFAMQVTSNVADAQQMTINFANNKLGGTGNYNPDYRTSKTRVCVTVGMMTTGYDCPDLLNLCLMRPIFSPSEFVQMKGRGTRKHSFTGDTLTDPMLAAQLGNVEKTTFKLFDFFANCEYFEEKFSYDEMLKLPVINKPDIDPTGGLLSPPPVSAIYENELADRIQTLQEQMIGLDGMKIDRMYFDQFEERVKQDPVVQNTLQTGDWDTVLAYIADTYFDKPTEFYNLDKLRRAVQVDRRISLREIVEKVLGLIPYFKSKDELLEDEFEKFDSRYLPDDEYFTAAKAFFKSYVTDNELREIIESRKYSLLNTNPNGDAFRHLSPELRKQIPEYIKDNISLNQFMA